MKNLNLSATLNLLRLVRRPNLCLPHATVSTFDQLPVPLDKLFTPKFPSNRIIKNHNTWIPKTDDLIKAIVLDKDNCFAMPHQNKIYDSYKVRKFY